MRLSLWVIIKIYIKLLLLLIIIIIYEMFVYKNIWNVCFFRFDRLVDKFVGVLVSI